MNLSRRAFLAGGAAVFATAAAPRPAAPPMALCPSGRFVGERQDGVAVFRGIRYGRAARFEMPRPAEPARDPVAAVRYGPACPQLSRRQPQSEDCLFLNIWTPDSAPRGRRPVMVYVHGGAFAFGSGSDPETEGHRLAAQGDLVVVTLNHRLNAFGYLSLARLDPRFPDSGNAGQLDLVLALQWVRANIAGFGGDPDRVTLFGQSGGGGKITTLMAMPAAHGLFRSVATMSGQQVAASGPIHATARARAFLARLKAAPGELAALPPERLLEGLAAEDPFAGGPLYMGPVLDARSLRRHPFWPDATPLGRGVAMMTGGTRDETRAFFPPDSSMIQTMSWGNVADRIAAELPVDLSPEEIVAAYRQHMPGSTPSDIFFAATTDGRSWRGQLEVAEARARSDEPAFAYQVDFTSRVDPRRGAEHAIDVPLVFGTLDAGGSQTGTGAEARAASARMQDCFVAFARSGDPNCRSVPRWPRYTLQERATMIFDTDVRLARNPRRWQRLLFAPAPYVQPGT